MSIASATRLGYSIAEGSSSRAAATSDRTMSFKCHCRQNAIESAGWVGLGGVLDASFHLPEGATAVAGEFLGLFNPSNKLVSIPLTDGHREALKVGVSHGVAQVALKRGEALITMQKEASESYRLTFKICMCVDGDGNCPAQTEPLDGVCCRPDARVQRQARATARLETQPPVTVRVVKCLESDVIVFRNMMTDFLHLGTAALAEATAEKAMSVLAGPNYCVGHQGGRCPGSNAVKPAIGGRKNIFELGE